MSDSPPKKPATLSLRAYARHRGCTLRAVQKALENGRIALAPDGKINPEECDRTWELLSDPSKKREAKVKRVMKHAEKFNEAKATREDYTSRLMRLKYEQQAGKLVDAAVVKKRAFENMRSLREAILNVPNQIAVELASETDPIKCGNLLTLELTRCLEEMSAPRISAAEAALEQPSEETDED